MDSFFKGGGGGGQNSLFSAIAIPYLVHGCISIRQCVMYSACIPMHLSLCADLCPALTSFFFEICIPYFAHGCITMILKQNRTHPGRWNNLTPPNPDSPLEMSHSKSI